MKTARIVLLLLLAVLLPARGVMAATMMCMPMPAGHLAHIHESAAHADHSAHAGHENHAGHSQGEVSHHSKGGCNLCSACCSASSPAVERASLPGPALAGDVSYAEPRSIAPRFESSGPERPPRSC